MFKYETITLPMTFVCIEYVWYVTKALFWRYTLKRHNFDGYQTNLLNCKIKKNQMMMTTQARKKWFIHVAMYGIFCIEYWIRLAQFPKFDGFCAQLHNRSKGFAMDRQCGKMDILVCTSCISWLLNSYISVFRSMN